ncbi:MAG TPA: biotin/lipoyl-containing protein, partial [Streptosporangiaceae bacterium]|nr:biotin/lipoyl-containing protein [Streptosporangiaceae bacterium]
EVAAAETDIGWVDVWAASRGGVPKPHAATALLQAGLEAYDGESALEQAQFYDAAARMRPEARPEGGRTVELRHRGQHYRLRVSRLGAREYRVEADGRRVHVGLDRLGEYERRLTVGSVRHRILSVVQGARHLVEVDGVSHAFSREDLGIIRAPAPAVVVSIRVKAGDEIAPGDRLAVLEAMKMEMPVLAPFPGRVRRVLVMNNVHVAPGAPLVQIDPLPAAEGRDTAGRIFFDFPPPEGIPGEGAGGRLRRVLGAMRRVMLGFDADPADTRRLAALYAELAPAGAPADAERRRTEDEVLGIFTDISSLFRRQTLPDDPDHLELLSTGEYFLTYLRTLDPQTAGLPPRFVQQLRSALAHYGVDRLDRTPELREALLWIYKSHQRVRLQVPMVHGILERRLAHGEPEEAVHDIGYRMLLDRLIAGAGDHHPSLSDLARQVRYRTFDRPLFDGARKRVYDEVGIHLSRLMGDPEPPDRQERLDTLVECPQPLQALLMGQFDGAPPHVRQLMLEVLSRRHYKVYGLEGLRSLALGDQAVGLGQYVLQGKQVHLLTSHSLDTNLAEAAGRLRPLVAAIPPSADVAIDLFVWRHGPLGDPERNGQQLQALLDRLPYGRPVQRIVFALAGPGSGPGRDGMQHFTFRPSAQGYGEDRLFRGLHPMIAKRLHLSRLANFEIERLPSVEDVYLFRGVARENPKDERLFALAEVRDLTPVRDPSGRVVRLPQLERMLMEALAGIRAFQAQRSPGERLQWNRVFLYVWPPFLLGPEAVDDLVQELGPATEGLGMEKVTIRARMPDPATGELREAAFSISNLGRAGFVRRIVPTSDAPIRSLTEYEQKVVQMRRRGMTYPYEIIRMLTPPKAGTRADLPPGEFQELDLDAGGRLAPVQRPYGQNRANVVVGLVTNCTPKVPEGMRRVVLLGDPSREVGSTAEPECRRIVAALDLAEEMGVPLEWFALSAGAKIAMESGTENLDATARVVRRIVTFTQAGGTIHLIVAGINVGAQSYFDALAT